MLMGLYIFLHIACLMLLGYLLFWIDYIYADETVDRSRMKKVITVVFLLGPFTVALFYLAIVLWFIWILINNTIEGVKETRK